MDDLTPEMQAFVDEAMRNPEIRAQIEQQHRAMDVAQLAIRAARGSAQDHDACDGLADQLAADPLTVNQAVDHLAALRTDYLGDRAFRLLTAARDRTDVRPIDPAVRDQFNDEARLGSVPLDRAFEELAALEPRLQSYAERLSGQRSHDPQAIMAEINESRLIGFSSSSPHLLLHSDLAVEIVHDYLQAQSDPSLLEGDTPVFERRQRTWVGTVLAPDDPRRRATN